MSIKNAAKKNRNNRENMNAKDLKIVNKSQIWEIETELDYIKRYIKDSYTDDDLLRSILAVIKKVEDL
jgi:hypothetical protein